MRQALLQIHAAAGIAGLVLGLVAFAPPYRLRLLTVVRRLYLAALLVLTVSVVAAFAIGWPEHATTARLVFGGLCGLAVLVVVRGSLAVVIARSPRFAERFEPYCKHVLFTWVALWEGFVILELLDADAPAWVIAAVMVAIPVAASLLLRAYLRRVGSTAPLRISP